MNEVNYPPVPPPAPGRSSIQVAYDAAVEAEKSASMLESKAITARRAATEAHIYAKLAIHANADGLPHRASDWARNALEAAQTAASAGSMIL